MTSSQQRAAHRPGADRSTEQDRVDPTTLTLPAVREDLTVEGRTALIIPVDGVGHRVDDWRRHTDPIAADVPAHITVLVPFVPLGDLGPDDEAWLRETFAAIDAPDLVLETVRSFPSAVWLQPRQTDFFVELTTRVWEHWPQHPPYEGAHDAVVPHLTVAHGEGLEPSVAADLAPELPLRCSIDAVHLFAWTGGGWSDRARFPFAG